MLVKAIFDSTVAKIGKVREVITLVAEIDRAFQ